MASCFIERFLLIEIGLSNTLTLRLVIYINLKSCHTSTPSRPKMQPEIFLKLIFIGTRGGRVGILGGSPRESQGDPREVPGGPWGGPGGCPGCSSLYRGRAPQQHTDNCRSRFRELMKENAKVINAEARDVIHGIAGMLVAQNSAP